MFFLISSVSASQIAQLWAEGEEQSKHLTEYKSIIIIRWKLGYLNVCFLSTKIKKRREIKGFW